MAIYQNTRAEEAWPATRRAARPTSMEVAIVSFHALAFLLFFISPLAGFAALAIGLSLAVGLFRPLPVALVAVGMLWINDPLADFYPLKQYTAWKDVLLVLMIGGFLLRCVIMRRPLVLRHEMSIPMLLLVSTFIVMCAGSPSVQIAVLGLKNTIFYMMWFFVLPDIIRTRNDARNLVFAILFGTFCIGAYNLWRVQQPIGTFPVRRDGKILHGAMMAHWSGSPFLLPIGIVMGAALISVSRGFARALLYAILAVGLAGLLATTVRAQWLATLAGLVAIGVVGRRSMQLITILLLVGVAGALIQGTSRIHITQRAVSSLDTGDESRLAREKETSDLMLPWVLRHPLGAGTGVMTARGSARVWGGNIGTLLGQGSVHNAFMQLAIEIGWFGLGIYAWILVLSVLTSLRAYKSARDPLMRNIALGVFGVAVANVVMQFFANMINAALISFDIWIVFGLIVLIPMIDRGEDPAAVAKDEPAMALA